MNIAKRMKVLIKLFQKFAGIKGTASLVDLRCSIPRETTLETSKTYKKVPLFGIFFSSLKEKKYRLTV